MIHRFARIHLTERRRDKVARMVSPETRSSVRPSSKATSAAISKVHRLVSYPNSLGERWSICRKASALCWSKAAYTRFGARGASAEGVWAPLVEGVDGVPDRLRSAPEASGYLRRRFPRALASRIWQRRITKASLDRSPASSRSRSFFDSSRTKIGGFMQPTIAHHTQPSLMMH